MAKLSPKYLAGLAIGCVLFAVFFIVGPQYPALHAILFYALMAAVFVALPFIVIQAKKEVVPARRSDIIGYAFICAFVGIVGGVAYFVLRG